MKSQKGRSNDLQRPRNSEGPIINAPEFEDTGVIYARNGIRGDYKGNVDQQERLCRALCEENDVEVVGVFKDDGASADDIFRPELGAAIRHCRDNKVGVLVVVEASRIAPDGLLYDLVDYALAEAGTVIIPVEAVRKAEASSGHVQRPKS